MKKLNLSYLFSIPRYLVRLGENDVQKSNDGRHEDVPVEKATSHPEFDSDLMINDIGMVHLQDHVNFSSKLLTLNIVILCDTFCNSNSFFSLQRSHSTDLFADQSSKF